MTPICRACGRHLEPAQAHEPAEHGTVRATLDGPATWHCPDGHEGLRADVTAALDEVHDLLDIAERTRFRGTLRCAECQTPFRLPGRRATRSVTLISSGLPATRITLDVPVLRCTEDAIESIPPECVEDLDAAITSLLTGEP